MSEEYFDPEAYKEIEQIAQSSVKDQFEGLSQQAIELKQEMFFSRLQGACLGDYNEIDTDDDFKEFLKKKDAIQRHLSLGDILKKAADTFDHMTAANIFNAFYLKKQSDKKKQTDTVHQVGAMGQNHQASPATKSNQPILNGDGKQHRSLNDITTDLAAHAVDLQRNGVPRNQHARQWEEKQAKLQGEFKAAIAASGQIPDQQFRSADSPFI